MRAPQTLVLLLLLIPLLLGVSASPAVAQSGFGSEVLSLQQESGGLSEEEELRYASRELRVRVWHDKDDEEVYERGEELRLYFRTNQDSYVVLYRIDADGYTEVLWPTSRYDDGFVFGGHTYSIPGRGAQLPLRVSNVKGVEYVEAIASQYPFDLRELGLDFRFDMEEVTDFAHRVSGDPFLAVNDINYAITGLEEDVDWVITDWTHVYIEDQVEYARYACTSCHTGDDRQYSPYTETCTQVAVYNDWGWHTRWYASFGYYPLYCDAPYYYWDRWYSRPYTYWYYPVYYSWPVYPVYVRPYPVYAWRTHTAYNGDYVTYYRRGQTSTRPLYDLDRAREGSKERERGRTRSQPSVNPRYTRGGDGGGRVEQGTLVRNGMPVRSREDRELEVVRDRNASRRVGVRSGQARPTRTVRSLPNEETARSPRAAIDADSPRTVSDGRRVSDGPGRRWTRPVVRNDRDANGSARGTVSTPPPGDSRRSRVGRQVSPPADRDQTRARPSKELRSGSVPRVRDSGSTPARRQVRSPQRRESSSAPPKRTVQPRSSNRSGNRRASEAKPQTRAPRRESTPRRTVTPTPRRSTQSGGSRAKSVTPPRQAPPRQKAPVRSGSSGRSGSKKGSSRGGRG